MSASNVFHQPMSVTAQERARANGHLGGVLWFTGLSGAGKTTLARELQHRLFEAGYQVYVLDGDNLRRGLNADLGFSAADRSENIRRVAEVAALFADAGMVVIAAFITPTRADRQRARHAASAAAGGFHSVYIRADLATCEARDVKGLYQRARAGELPEFTGISSPYEAPEHPELVIDTQARTIAECVSDLQAYVARHFGVPEGQTG